MPQQINQDVQQDNPDETAAVLSFATNLSQQMMPKAHQTQETAPTSVPIEETEEQPTEEENATEEFMEVNEELEKTMDSKLD